MATQNNTTSFTPRPGTTLLQLRTSQSRTPRSHFRSQHEKGQSQPPRAPQTAEGSVIANRFNHSNIINLVSRGKNFSVTFIKRTTGELREMRCEMGVTKHLKGGSTPYGTKAKNLLSVFDTNAKGYRSIPVGAIQKLSVGGQTFQFGRV